MRVLKYWEYYPSTGQSVERKFHTLQTYLEGYDPYIDGEYIGLPFIKAAVLVEKWNKKMEAQGVVFLLHPPEKYKIY